MTIFSVNTSICNFILNTFEYRVHMRMYLHLVIWALMCCVSSAATVSVIFDENAHYGTKMMEVTKGVSYDVTWLQTHPIIFSETNTRDESCKDWETHKRPCVNELNWTTYSRNNTHNTISIKVPDTYSGELWYYCANHPSMGPYQITISDTTPTTTAAPTTTPAPSVNAVCADWDPRVMANFKEIMKVIQPNSSQIEDLESFLSHNVVNLKWAVQGDEKTRIKELSIGSPCGDFAKLVAAKLAKISAAQRATPALSLAALVSLFVMAQLFASY